MTKFYAACNVNGPISVSIEASSIDDAVAIFAELDQQGMIDAAKSDAEDDLDFDGPDMSESEFEGAMAAAGFVVIRDLSEIHNYHGGTSCHLLDGWQMFGATGTLTND